MREQTHGGRYRMVNRMLRRSLGHGSGVTSRRPSAMGVAAAMALGLAVPAAAQVNLECRSWRRLSEDQKLQTIDLSVEDLISGSRGREYTSIDRIRTRRCLDSHRNQIVDDFDELCGRGTRAELEALN